MTELQKAAQAVCDRWDSPDWSDDTHTLEYINRLRKAIEREPFVEAGTVQEDENCDCEVFLYGELDEAIVSKGDKLYVMRRERE